MSKLRVLEEERRKPKKMPFKKREKIINIIKQIFEKEDFIEVAAIHGGFLNSRIFRDIDIAIYINEKMDLGSQLIYIEELKDKLEKATGIGVDIQLINEAPPTFTYNVLNEGRIILEKKNGVSSILKIHALEEIKKLRR